MRSDTATACSGPSTRASQPLVDSVASISARRGASAVSRAISASTASATDSSQVISHDRPSGPCSAWTITSMAAKSGGAVASATTTISDGPAKAAAMPTSPATSRLARATYRLPGPAMTSTAGIVSVP